LASFHFEEHDSFDGLCLSFGEKSPFHSVTGFRAMAFAFHGFCSTLA
jgi:hypothetical protein